MFIPGGVTVISDIWAIMRDPKEYEDPFTLKPERSLVESPPTDLHNYTFELGRGVKDVASAMAFMSITCTLHCFNIEPRIGADSPDPSHSVTSQNAWRARRAV